jgi:dTDP-4-amino-4,6-dideoxygalactose transaminase
MSPEQLLKQKMAEISGTNSDDWFVVSRARHGMEQVFRQLKMSSSAVEVITQPFTCVTAINPIIAAGLDPVYCDISAQNYSIDARRLSKLLCDQTRAVIMQHSFGIPADIDGIRQAIGTKSAVMIMEDSAHCLGYIAKQNGVPIADLSVHSFGAEKILGTSFGGAIWVNPLMIDKNLRDNIAEALANLPKASMLISARVWLYPRLNGVLNRLPNSISLNFRRILLKSKMFRSPIVPMEQKAVNYEPAQRPRGWQIKLVLSSLEALNKNTEHRAELTQIYNDKLGNDSWSGLALLRYPVLAKTPQQAEKLFAELKGKGMPVGKWYRPLFFPGIADYNMYSYSPGSCPVAEDISARIINLPTGLNIKAELAKEIAYAFKA